MARTKPTEALKKILAVEQIRLRQRNLDANFQRDLAELKSIAKRLASAPSGLIPISKLSEISEKSLLPTDDERAFHDIAERFKITWNFQPRWNDEGKVELFLRSSISAKLEPGKTSWNVVDDGRFPPSDLAAFIEHHISARRRARAKIESKKGRPSPQQRRRLDTDKERLAVRELKAKGLTKRQIAQKIWPKEYEDLLKQDNNALKELRPLAVKYMMKMPPDNLSWPEAERRAASELGLDMRSESAKLQKLTRRIHRHLLDK